MDKITYTTILHSAREQLELTANEYCIADIIYHLSNNPKSKIQGWCYASRQTIGSFVGITKQSIFSIITKLEKKNIIEKDNETKYLRTTENWYNIVVINRLKCIGKETLPAVKKTDEAVKKTDGIGKETLPNIYNNINKDNIYMPIYNFYQEKINQKSKLTEQAKKKIKARLKVYSIEELKEAMVKFSQEDWWMKNNSHRGVAWFFHSDDRIDQFLNFKEITLEQIAVKMVKECEDKFGFDKGANIASFRFQRKYGDEELLKYQKIFKGEV